MKKILIAGMGFMGVTHAKNVLANPDLQLCGIVDVRGDKIFSGMENLGNMGKLNSPMEKLKQTPVFTSLEEGIAATSADAAIICTPLFLHYEMTKTCLNGGLDVLLEKPFCPEVGQCRELIELAQKRERILMVAHCVRFAPQWEFLKQCILDERYGKLRLLSTSRMTGEPAWGVWQDPEIKKTCGGSLFDLLIHDIDFANYCFGRPGKVKVNLNRDEYWELQLDYETQPDCAVSVKGGFLHRNSPFISIYVATFERASLTYNTQQLETVHIGSDEGLQTVEIQGDAYQEELKYFADCIETRQQPFRCLPIDSLHAIEICREIDLFSDNLV